MQELSVIYVSGQFSVLVVSTEFQISPLSIDSLRIPRRVPAVHSVNPICSMPLKSTVSPVLLAHCLHIHLSCKNFTMITEVVQDRVSQMLAVS